MAVSFRSRAMGWVGSGWVALEPMGGYGLDVHLPLQPAKGLIVGEGRGWVWALPYLGIQPYSTHP